MFSPTGLFCGVPCPLGTKCYLLRCFFSHEEDSTEAEEASGSEISHGAKRGQNGRVRGESPERPSKRQRHGSSGNATKGDEVELIEGNKAITTLRTQNNEATNTPSRNGSTPSPGMHSRAVDTATMSKTPRGSPPNALNQSPSIQKPKPSTPLQDNKKAGTPQGKPENMKPPPLAPKNMGSNTAAPYQIRHKLLCLIHEQFARLNNAVKSSNDPRKEAVLLSPAGLVQLAIDEEWNMSSKQNRSVYQNVMKLRIGSLKKMKTAAWIESRVKELAAANGDTPSDLPKKSDGTIDTGLTPREEIAFLPELAQLPKNLDQHGYVLKPIPEAEVQEAKAALVSAGNWEVCDRCGTRFQAFPGRRLEDGALTTGGSCTYHWGKARRPRQSRGSGANALQGDRYLCCDADVGQPGCTTAPCHVFVVKGATRLSVTMPFETTQAVGPPVPRRAVAFDCEMGYTTLGLEIIRLTAVSWPDGGALIDVLVRPEGEILDLNSRFSGVRMEHFSDGIPYPSTSPGSVDKGQEEESLREPNKEGKFRVLGSPQAARSLLMKHIDRNTPLIGHAIDNDLNCVRLIHPFIIDTVLLFPHPKGLPIRHGLRALAKMRLNMDIQTSGDQGHDSKEDARATGELVRYKVKEAWSKMKEQGWTIKDHSDSEGTEGTGKGVGPVFVAPPEKMKRPASRGRDDRSKRL